MSLESRDMQEYNTLYQSLREVLRPASVWFRDLQRFESIAGLTVEDTGGENSIWKSDNYLVPYTFAHPVYAEMLHERHPNVGRLDLREIQSFTHNDVQEWIDRIKERMHPYISGCVSDDVVSDLDSSADIGIIVHKTGGHVFPFSYSDTKDIMFQMIPEQTVILLARYAASKASTKKMFDALNGIIQQCQEHMRRSGEAGYYMYYTPVKKDGSLSHNIGTFTWQDTIPIQDTHELTKYMRIMFKCHAKCFIVP